MVLPPLIGATSFTQFRSALFFLAISEGRGRSLWRVDADNLGHASLVKSVAAVGRGDVSRFFADSESARLYLQASYKCPGADCFAWVKTFFSSDGTPAGTTDLRRRDACSSVCARAAERQSAPPRNYPSQVSLWGVLFLAVLPMMLLATAVLVTKQMPGLFLNLFFGAIAAAVVIYWLATYETHLVGLDSFLKWFLTIYTSALWVALLAWSVVQPSPPDLWLDELKSWAVTLVSVTFFLIIHFDLEIPRTLANWPWVVYAIIILLQMVCSAVVSRTVPLVASAIGLFILAGKIAGEVVDIFDVSGSPRFLAVLLVFALQGIAIIVGAIMCGGHMDKLRQLGKDKGAHVRSQMHV